MEAAGVLRREMFVDQGAQLHGQLILHAVIHSLAVPLPRQDAGSREQGQVLGNIGLGCANRRHNLADRPRLAADGLQDAQAHRFAQ